MDIIEKNVSVIPLWIPIVLGNLIPLYGALFLSWDIFTIFFLFWIENVIIGFYTVVKMLTVGGQVAFKSSGIIKIGAIIGVVFFSSFFTIHYGMFCMGHFSFLVSFFYERGDTNFGFGVKDTTEFVKEFMVGGIYWGVLAIFIAEGVKTVIDFQKPTHMKLNLGSGRIPKETLDFLKKKSPDLDVNMIGKVSRVQHLMFEPYGRIIILHITIIFGGMLVQFLGDPIWGLALLIFLKIAYDFGAIDPIKRLKAKKLKEGRGI